MIVGLRRIALMTAALLAMVPGARAELLRDVIDDLVEAPAPDVAVEQANEAALAQFETALAVYDRRIEQQPSDVIAQLHRCRFMSDFAGSYETAEFVSGIGERRHHHRTELPGQQRPGDLQRHRQRQRPGPVRRHPAQGQVRLARLD